MDNRASAQGFNLPSAYKSHDGSLNHKIAIAVLFASTGIAAVLFAQLVGV